MSPAPAPATQLRQDVGKFFIRRCLAVDRRATHFPCLFSNHVESSLLSSCLPPRNAAKRASWAYSLHPAFSAAISRPPRIWPGFDWTAIQSAGR